MGQPMPPPATPPGNGQDRLKLLERRVERLEERTDQGFANQGRQLNIIQDGLADLRGGLESHQHNHHGRATVLRQSGGLGALAATLVYAVVELIRRLWPLLS